MREGKRDHRVVRYDERGNGLSDWKVEDLSFTARVRDLEAVVEAVGLDRFVLLGISQGGPVAIAYTFRHPEHVSHLILYGAYAQGAWKRSSTPEERARLRALVTLTKQGWGQDNPAYRQLWTSLFMPDATPEQMRWFNELQQVSTSSENAVRFLVEFGQIDVLELLSQLRVPTLVLHCQDDLVVTFEYGRRLAALIPGARFVPLQGRNHLPQPTEPAWETFLAVRHFLGTRRESLRFEAGVGVAGPEKTSLSLGAVLGHYRILEKIGAGGMGEVYRAHDEQLDRDVAIKILLGSSFSNPARLLGEARAASRLNHPHICIIHEAGEADGQAYIAMELVEGQSLSVRLAGGALPAFNWRMHWRTRMTAAWCIAT